MTNQLGESLRTAGAKLLLAGLGLSVGVSAVVAVIVGFATGGHQALSYVIGAAIGVVALALSQVIVMLASKLPESLILVVALVAYAFGFICALLMLTWLKAHTGVAMLWTGIGVIVGAFSYLLAVAVFYPRLRILIFAPPSTDDTPDNTDKL